MPIIKKVQKTVWNTWNNLHTYICIGKYVSMSLPLTHVTPWENFLSIMKDNALVPQYCPLFKEDILYMSYGRLAYKPSRKNYDWNENLPVVLFFDSNRINNLVRFFPFDTGAIITGRFSHTNLNDKKFIKRISTEHYYAPSKWIEANYSNQLKYIECESPDLITENSEINSMLSEAYSILKNPSNNLDYRLTTIECHFKNAFTLNSAITIAIPFEKRDEFLRRNNLSKINVFYYVDKSQDGYLPYDLTQFATNAFQWK